MKDFDIIVGAPFLRLMPDGSIRNVYGKPLLFDRYGYTTTFIGGKARRVKREDILRCAAERSDISLLYPKRRPKLPPPKQRKLLNAYREISANISLFASAIIEQDESRIVNYFMNRLDCYIAHFNYLKMNEDDLRDYVMDAILDVARLIYEGSKVIAAPDNYIIRVARTKMSQDKERLRQTRLSEYV